MYFFININCDLLFPKDQLKLFFDRIGEFRLKKLKVWADLSSVRADIISGAMIKLEESHCIGSERTFSALSKPTPDQLKSIFATIAEERNLKLRNRLEHSHLYIFSLRGLVDNQNPPLKKLFVKNLY